MWCAFSPHRLRPSRPLRMTKHNRCSGWAELHCSSRHNRYLGSRRRCKHDSRRLRHRFCEQEIVRPNRTAPLCQPEHSLMPSTIQPLGCRIHAGGNAMKKVTLATFLLCGFTCLSAHSVHAQAASKVPYSDCEQIAQRWVVDLAAKAQTRLKPRNHSLMSLNM